MKKYTLISTLFILLLLNGCNQQGHTDGKELVTDTTKMTETSDTEKESVEEEIAVDSEEDDTITIFDLNLIVTSQLKEKLRLEENSETSICLSIEDTTVLNRNVVLGCIDKISPDMVDPFEGSGMHNLVYYDANHGSALGFMQAGENPYVGHKEENEVLPEEHDYKVTYYELERSLLNYGFHNWSIQPEQTLPEILDSNQEVGIEIAENMLNDILNWYEPLKEAIEQERKSDEWFQLLDNVAEESYLKYPEIRQIPFPTTEIGGNISRTIFEFQSLNAGLEEKSFEKLRTENLILNIGNAIDIIQKQLEEIKATYQ